MKLYGIDSVSSWVVALGSGWVMFFTMGLFRSYGVFYVTILDQFQVTRQDASWPFSLCSTLQNVGGLLPGILSQYFSLKQITLMGGAISGLGVSLCYFTGSITWLTIFFGIVYGVGSGLIIPSQPVLLNQCFERYRASACGICFSGAALSSMIFPLLGQKLLDEYGLNGTLLIFGALVFNILVGASLLSFANVTTKITKAEDSSVSSESDTLLNVRTLKAPSRKKSSSSTVVVNPPPGLVRMMGELLSDSFFYFTALSSSTGWLGCFTFAMVVVDFGQDQMLPKNEAVLLIIVYSATEFVGRLCSGWVSDSGLLKRKNVVLSAASASGFVLCAFPFVRTPIYLFILTGFYGLLVGSQIIIYYVLLADYIDASKLPLAVSLAFSFGGMFSLLRPSVVGLIRDKLGRYDELFYILGVLSLIGGLVWLLEPYVLDIRKRRLKTLLVQ